MPKVRSEPGWVMGWAKVYNRSNTMHLKKAWKSVPKRINKCECGSRRFKVSITLEIMDMPVYLSPRGIITYNDTKGQSMGWDTIGWPAITCVKCAKLLFVTREANDRIVIQKPGEENGD